MPLKTYGNLPVLFLDGAAAERGRKHGRALGEAIHRYVGKVREIHARTGVSWTTALERARRYADTLRRIEPDACLELEGIAEGAELPFETIVALNAPHELRTAEGCTTIIALPSATASGHTLIGKNYDEPYERLQTDALFVIDTPDAPRFATLASVGTLSRDGFNAAGLLLLGNGLSAPGDGTVSGIPFPVLRRHLLAQPDAHHAETALRALPRSHACNYNIVSATGVAAAFEATVSDVFRVQPENGLLVHTNHFVSPDIPADSDLCEWGEAHSRFRIVRANELMQPRIGEITLEHIRSTLADHEACPESVCSHRDGGGSIASYWMDLDEGVFHIANGRPCETEPFAIPLADLGIAFAPVSAPN